MNNDTVVTQLKGLNPVEPTTTFDNEEWEEMFANIVGRPQRARKSPLWRRPTITIPVFVALTGAAFLLTTAVAGDKVIEVQAADALSDPRGLEQELARQGLDARIVDVPSENLAGKWYGFHIPPNADIDMETFWLLKSYVGHLDMRYESVEKRCPIGDCARTGLLEIPGRVKGPITLVVGREPRAGEEPYWTDAFGINEISPGGALWCHALEEKSPSDAGRLLRSLGYEIVWVHEDRITSEEVSKPPAGAVVTSAFMRGPDLVDIRTAMPELANKWRIAEGTPTAKHPRSSAPWAPPCN